MSRKPKQEQEVEAEVQLEPLCVADGFRVGGTKTHPYFADESGNAYFVSTDRAASLREKALAKLLLALHEEANQ